MIGVGIGIVAIAAVAVPWILRRPQPPLVHEPAPSRALLPYPELMSLADRVKALQAERRYAEALPGARALLEQHEMRGHLVSSMLVDYGRMENNAAFEAGPGAPRSSFERIALEKQALMSAQAALEMARTPRERAEGITLVGLVHEAWGFPYDAYLTYRAAMGTDSTYVVAREHHDTFVSRLRLMQAQAPK